MQLIEKPKPIERSWPGGPLRQCHRAKTDLGWQYVCDGCLGPAKTGVRLQGRLREWLCASCERGLMRSQDPELSFVEVQVTNPVTARRIVQAVMG